MSTRPVIICFFFILALLSGCSHVKKGDGPPDFYVDETRISNAVPKVEPLSKYGNYKSYVTLGKRYHTLPSNRNYEAIGTASWYGKKFHSRKTSNGEQYDMLKMTAAHKTLPLPTYLEVTNLANNRKVIVRVNDRGPFVSDRLIDLSYVAAKKLGMLGHGTARVKVKAIHPHSYASTTKHSNQQFQSFYLQVGAFRNKNNANALQRRLSTLISMPVKVHQTASKHSLYKVKIGPFTDLAYAETITNRLLAIGIQSKKADGA
jgi:rare lipoprotein A